MDEHTFIATLLNVWMYHLVHPHIEYANSVWCPFKLGDIKEIKKSKRGPQNS